MTTIGGPELDADVPAWVRIAGSVVEHVAECLGQANRIAFNPCRLLRHADLELVPARLDAGPRGLLRLTNDFVQIDASTGEFECSARDPADVDQIINQTVELRTLPVDYCVDHGIAGIADFAH